jgi:predicted RNA-binding protein with PUA-like domain
MARWLLKTEPDSYNWSDLARDKQTVWDGVTNALALKHIRSMKKGDQLLVYHTGDERAVVGTATVASAPYADPKAADDRVVVVEVKVGRKLAQPVTLSDIKADPAFAGWDLIRNGRLGVVPVPDAMWDRIEELSRDGKESRR